MSKYRCLIAALLMAVPCPAAWLTVGDRSELGASDQVAWETMSGNYDALSNRFVATSKDGAPVEVSQAGAAFLRLDQSAGWFGNFAPGDALLWTYFGGPITLDFGPFGVNALGFQVQPDLYGEYSAQLDLFDAAGRLIASVSGDGTSTSLADGSALFLGIRGDSTFHQARISITNGDSPDSFAISTLDFAAAPVSQSFALLAPPLEPSGSTVPEPATFALAAFAVGGLALARRGLRKL